MKMALIDLVKQLRERYPAMQFILMSGYTETPTLPKTIDSDGIQFMQKPFSLSEIAERVAACLNR